VANPSCVSIGVCVATNSMSSALTPPGGAGVIGIREDGRDPGAYFGTEALAGGIGASSEGVGATEVVR
jgi:hypothetical protein